MKVLLSSVIKVNMQGSYTSVNISMARRHGQGTYIRADGSKYVGQWKYGRQNGQGTLTYLDGRVQEGIFENGKFLYAKKTPPRAIAMRHNHDRLREIEIEVLG